MDARIWCRTNGVYFDGMNTIQSNTFRYYTDSNQVRSRTLSRFEFYITDLYAAVALCERVLPGWWWRVGTCHVSDDATVGPDYNSPVHGERLHREFPPKKTDHGWDEWIFDVDQRPPHSVALALCLAILRAKAAAHD